jgi:mono/diheme cytochrome c family protein
MPGNDDEYGAQVWLGYTYVWNAEQTDAVLLDAAGEDRTYTIQDVAAPGGARQQTWHFPSRSECALCHTMAAKYALGVNTLQMNRDFDHGDGHPANQLEKLSQWGVFTRPLPAPPAELPHLARPEDRKAPLEDRARAYLHANCSHCHRLWGGGLADFSLPADVPLAKTGIINTAVTRGDHGISGAKIVVPGDAAHSMLLHRMELTGLGRMPHVASHKLDDEGIALIREWISTLKQPASSAP